MRTTLSLDNDVLERARHLAAKQRKPFKAIVNEALRAGMSSLEKSARQKRYVTDSHAMGLRKHYDLDNVQELIAQLEGEHSR